ncbi:MAG: alanine--glyoxylate aminotransferase family protein [Nocardioides sp.]|uniref:pyridoxal-phosphate-dependent aminotransferase family protein n=1 Tax=Nocardioides sp. TaxID=35761 RepID=UPI0039E2B30A
MSPVSAVPTDPTPPISPPISMPISMPARLLMGPGPITVDPRVLHAAATQMVGQFDPAMTAAMTEVMALYRTVFATENEQTFLVDGTSRAGIEAALVSLIEPGDDVLVVVFGRFGQLLVEIAGRCGARVHTVEVPWGEVVPVELVEEACRRVRPRLIAVVQGDTSTTMCQPLADLGELAHRYQALLYVDATASIGGNPFETDAWGIDVATAGLQKCLGGPSGSAPITLSPAAVAAIERRKRVEAGIRTADDDSAPPAGTPIASNYLDLAQIIDYWGPRRLNHHTEATTMLYAAREAARLLVAETLPAAIDRHRRHGEAMLAGVRGLGLGVFGDVAHKMTNVVAVEIPETLGSTGGDRVRAAMLTCFGIEIGTSFGPLAGRVWRIGTMGYNARQDAVLLTLAALEQVLRAEGVPVSAGGGVAAASEVYAG